VFEKTLNCQLHFCGCTWAVVDLVLSVLNNYRERFLERGLTFIVY